MTDLYRAWSPDFPHPYYGPVTVSWFCYARPGPPASFDAYLAPGLTGDERGEALACARECFTSDEEKALEQFLQNRLGVRLNVTPAELPFRGGFRPVAWALTGTGSEFFNLEDVPGYDLPFTVHGVFDYDPEKFGSAYTFRLVGGELASDRRLQKYHTTK